MGVLNVIPDVATLLNARSPAAISGLKAWYDFSDPNTLFTDTARTAPVSADGDSIRGVRDKAGLHHLSQAGNAPVYKTDRVNGKSSALFTSASSQFLATGTSTTIPKGTSELTVAAVVKMSVGAARICGWASDTGWLFGASTTIGRFSFRSVADYDTPGQFGNPDSVYAMHIAIVDSGQDVTWYRNGVAGTKVNGSAFGNDPTTSAFQLGASFSGNFWNGDITEFAVFSGDIGASARDALEVYWGVRYLMQVA